MSALRQWLGVGLGLGLAILSWVIGGLITNNPGRAWRVLAERRGRAGGAG